MSSSDPWVDKLTIETPEQTSLEYPLAGVGSRFLAIALDTLIQSGVTIVLFTLFVIVIPSGQLWQGTINWASAILIFCLFLISFGYFAFFEAIWNGQTPGKRLTRLRVIQDSGRPITAYQAVTRNMMRIADYLPGLYLTGIISVLVSKQNKRLGDFVAGTVVVHEKPFEQSRMSWETPAAETPAASPFNASRLSSDELQLIESFLQRRDFLDGDVRATLARQIAIRIAEKLGIAPEAHPAPERFLEDIARERRGMGGYR